MKLTKKHKLFIVDSKGTARRLDKINKLLYFGVIREFTQGTAAKQYADKNKDANRFKGPEPIEIKLNDILKAEMKKITDAKTLLITYNGTWQPLVRLTT